jgi:hypothetical protein
VANKKFMSLIATTVLIFTNALPSHAAGKYDWWAIRSDGSWFKNGVVCWNKSSDIKIGNKATFSVKLGQSQTFKTLGTAVGLSGDKLISATWDRTQPDDLMKACSNGSKSVAFISPKTPEAPGAYILRIAMYNSKGRFLWNNESKVLNDTSGADSGFSYFTNPPELYFTQKTYENLKYWPSLIGYTSTGNKRNACLVIRDFINYSGGHVPTKSELIYNIQQGNAGDELRGFINGSAIPIALKCVPWMVDYIVQYG